MSDRRDLIFSFALFFNLTRPGTCAGDGSASDYKSSVQFPDDMLTFIKSYPLMDEAVPSVNDRPCFTRTSSRYFRAHTHTLTGDGSYPKTE